MKKEAVWNNWEFANEETVGGKPIVIPFGSWPWSDRIDQRFRREEAEKIAGDLDAFVKGGGPGIPVYQGHPDVPTLAAKYPDKGALGWIKRIEVGEKECRLAVEWDRWPGKGFAWFSPYWLGEPERGDNGKTLVTIDEIRSVGLVNRPNIKSFRLPNEELVEETNKEKNMKEIMLALGLAETATPAEAVAAIGQLKSKAETCAAEKAKAEADKIALDDECKKQKCCNEELQKQLDAQKTELANSQKELGEAKTALANEQAEVEKLKGLKTKSETVALANEQAKDGTRLGLVNELMTKQNCDFDTAWAAAKEQKPDLFK